MQSLETWKLNSPLDAIIFDCDSTLSTIEGIDELAKKKGVYTTVQALTETAMSKTGLNAALYEERLNLIKPTQQEVSALGETYLRHQTPDAAILIKIFQTLQKPIYLISAGLSPAVIYFGEQLNILRDHIFSVDVLFDSSGNYMNYDRTSLLVEHNGKRNIVEKIKEKYSKIAYVGDGLNDIAVFDLVTRFIGFGGVSHREIIAEKCQFYIETLSLLPILPLTITHEEFSSLSPEDKKFFHKGMSAIEKGEVRIKNLSTLLR